MSWAEMQMLKLAVIGRRLTQSAATGSILTCSTGKSLLAQMLIVQTQVDQMLTWGQVSRRMLICCCFRRQITKVGQKQIPQSFLQIQRNPTISLRDLRIAVGLVQAPALSSLAHWNTFGRRLPSYLLHILSVLANVMFSRVRRKQRQHPHSHL